MNVSTSAQRKARRRLLKEQGVEVFGGQAARDLAKGKDFKEVFKAVFNRGPENASRANKRADAALAAFAKQTGFEAITLEKRLTNTIKETLKLDVPIRRIQP